MAKHVSKAIGNAAFSPPASLSGYVNDNCPYRRLRGSIEKIVEANREQHRAVVAHRKKIVELKAAIERLEGTSRAFGDSLDRIRIAKLGRKSARLAGIMDSWLAGHRPPRASSAGLTAPA